MQKKLSGVYGEETYNKLEVEIMFLHFLELVERQFHQKLNMLVVIMA